MNRYDRIEVTTEVLEQMSFDSGMTITIGQTEASLRAGKRVFYTPIVAFVPEQRTATEES